MLQKILTVYPSEQRKLFLFWILGFTWSLAASIGVALSDALFLQYVGSHSLPITFILIALGMFLSSFFFMYLFNRNNINYIFKKYIYVAIGFYSLIALLMLLGIRTRNVYIFYKIFSYVFQIGLLSCFWTFLDQYYDLQNAKRIFSILYSAIFLGMAFAGGILALYFTSLHIFGMLWIIIASLFASIFILNYIIGSLPPIEDDHQEFSVIKTTPRQIVSVIVKSPFTSIFISVCIVIQTLMIITEFEYMNGLEKFFASKNPEVLTCFLGKLYFWGSMINIFFGVLLYGRIVNKIGLNNIILFVPIFFFSLFSGWVVSSHLMFSVLGFIAVEGILNLLEDNNFNLLLNAVPLRLKNKIRITCESLLEPFGMIISSLLIIVFKGSSKKLGLVVSAILLLLTLLLRAYYTKGIFYNLISHVIPFRQNSKVLHSKISKKEFKETQSYFFDNFFSFSQSEQIFIVEYALHFKDYNFLELILNKVTKLDLAIKKEILILLDSLPSDKIGKLAPYVSIWLQQHEQIRNQSILFLTRHHQLGKEETARISTTLTNDCISKQMDSENDLEVKLSLALLTHTSDDSSKKKAFLMLSNTSFEIQTLILMSLEKISTLEDSSYTPLLFEYIEKHPEYKHRLLALKVLKKIVDPSFIKELVIRGLNLGLHERNYISELIKTMKGNTRYELLRIFHNTHIPYKSRLMVARILSEISKNDLKKNFEQIVNREISTACFYHYHLYTIQKTYPYTNLHLLEIALKSSRDSILEFILETMALINNFEEAEYFFKSLKSKRPKTYSHALEMFEKICSKKYYHKLLPMLKTGFETSFYIFYHKNQLPILALDPLLDKLEHTPSLVNQVIVKTLKNRLNIPINSTITDEKLLSGNFTTHFTEGLLEVSLL